MFESGEESDEIIRTSIHSPPIYNSMWKLLWGRGIIFGSLPNTAYLGVLSNIGAAS